MTDKFWPSDSKLIEIGIDYEEKNEKKKSYIKKFLLVFHPDKNHGEL